MKYIDADKLIAEIRNRESEYAELIKSTDEVLRTVACAKIGELEYILSIIHSLQQDKAAVELELCNQSWWEERGWIMIPPETTIEGIDSLLKAVRRKLQQKCPPVLAEFMEKASEIGEKYNYGFGPNLPQPRVDLEKEIQRYLREECSGDDEPTVSEIAHHFAKWQKEQMLKDAVEGEVHPDDCEIWVNLAGYGYKFNDGDKARIIILKEATE